MRSKLARLINRHHLQAKVNLIPHNPAEPLPYQPSSAERVESFRQILEAKGVHAFVRRPRGTGYSGGVRTTGGADGVGKSCGNTLVELSSTR